MKKIFVTAVAVLGSWAVFAGASTGNCQKKAVSLKTSQQVRLVDEWDPDFGEYYETGAYYYKVTISKGSAATISLQGGSASEMMLDVYTDWESDYYTAFDIGETNDGSIKYARLAPADWDEDDPSKVTFYVYVTGDIGQTATLNYSNSYVSFVPVGSEDNPLNLSFSETEKSATYDFVDGSFVFTASLTAGRLYRFRTVGGTDENPIALSIDNGEDYNFIDYDDAAYAADTNNVACILSPSVSGTYTLEASGNEGTSFSFVYQMLRARKINEHKTQTLDAKNEYSAKFVPGRRIANWDFADNIIDEQLFAITLEKGSRWVFETQGADKALVMEIYDSNGKLLQSNSKKDSSSLDLRAAIQADKNGVYYVGVCDPNAEPGAEVSGAEVTLTAENVTAINGDPDEWDALDDATAGATALEVLPGTIESDPVVDGSVHGVHYLSRTDWADTFVIGGRKGLNYRMALSFVDESSLPLDVSVFTLSGTVEKQVVSSEVSSDGKEIVSFEAKDNAAYYIRVRSALGNAIDCSGYNIHVVAYSTSGDELGILTVNTLGTNKATWSLDRESVKYPGGSSVLLAGDHTVKFSRESGFTTPVAQTVKVNPGKEPTVVNVYYSDTSDPADDVAKGAKSWALKNTSSVQTRTLWKNDPEDNFVFAAKDGEYYSFAFESNTGDAVFSITNAEVGMVAENVTSIEKLALKGTRSKYYLTVRHADSDAAQDGAYALSGFFANVGAIKFAKTSVSSKENASSVKLTVNRTSRDGLVRVRYGTVAGSAKPGVDYIAQSGVLEWANGDNKAKTIEVKLIADLVANWESNKTFSVQLKPFEEDECGKGEYVAQIAGDTCTVTLTEVSRAGTTVESTYATKAPKLATVKTENVALETGTFYGVLSEDGFALTNGAPALASVSLTVAAREPADISAKVVVASKTYTFKTKGWDDVGVESDVRTRTLENVQKIAGITYTNTLSISVTAGNTMTSGDWMKSGASVELVMNVPDANNKGAQEDIRYFGNIYRDNSKIQDYFNVVTNFTGYYTVALVPDGVLTGDGVPAGNGYLTLTIDNKGTVKAAGMLADGKTKPSITAKACAIVEDAESANGYSMLVPLYMSKSTICFGGELRVFVDPATGKTVVDSTKPLIFNDDDPKSTYWNYEGFTMSLLPVGGWYDLFVNLQTYYLTSLFEVETIDGSEIPAEAVTAGYNVVADAQPNGTEVAVAGDAFSCAKKTLYKNGKLYDLAGSINPCNVQVKLARATGLVTGSFSVWSENADGSSQKEVSGFKHNGVVILARDSFSPVPEEYVSLGFLYKSMSVQNENPDTGKTVKHNWNFSAPFNILAIDQGDVDWWENDWGYED